jgi:4-amino-4-deoxy-L-arabinose transferase-like glycosyltransferase
LVLLFLLYFSLFILTSLSRTRQLSADSLNYIDVARNLRRGQGLVQSTLVIARPPRFWDEVRTISPFVSQPPLYPLAIAALGNLAPSFTDAALLVSGLSLAAAVCAGFLLTRELYDEPTAWLAAAALAVAPHLAYVSRWAWSEALGITLVLLTLWLLAWLGKAAVPRTAAWLALAAGLSAGLAFATRYAFVILAALGIIMMIWTTRSRRRRLRDLVVHIILFLCAWALPVALVAGHNLVSINRLLPTALPSDKGWLPNLGDAVQGLFGSFLSTYLAPGIHYTLWLLVLATITMIAWRQGRLGAYFAERLLHQERWLLWLWPVLYTAFIVLQRSQSFFDELDIRLLAPAGVTLWLAIAGLLSGLLTRKRVPLLVGMAAVLLGLGIAQQLRLVAGPPVSTPAQQLADSPRLSWLADHTTARDLVIGDTTNDIPYFFDRQAAVSFSAYPYTIFLTPSTIEDLANQYCRHYDNLYLVLRKRPGTEIKHRQFFGRYVSNMLHRDPGNDPELALAADLPDSRIFRLTSCDQAKE